eukprot:403332737
MHQAQMQLQLQAQQFNLPAVNQSRSERSLENTSGYGNLNVGQTQRLNMGALTSRGNNDQATLSQIQLIQSQQMIPSNYSNNQGGVASQQIKSSQNENMKSYSRKLAKIVQSGVSGGGGSASNSRTPNAKKKMKPTTLGLASALTQSINNTQGIMKSVRSGLSTSRGTTGITPSMLATSQIYNNGSQALHSARANIQLQSNNNGSRGQSNTTFDMEEHIKNVMKSVERRNRQNPYNQNISNINPLTIGASSSYLQTNISQLLGNTQMMNQIQNIGGGNNGSKTARNQVISHLNEYSPDHGQSLSKSPTNRNQSIINPAIYAQATTTSNKNTVFSNFSNNNYFIGQKKNSQQSHSLGKKSSYQGNLGIGNQSTILIQQQKQQNPNNISGSLSRKRGSTKRDAIIMMSKQIMQNNNQSRQQNQESEIFSATQRSIKGYDDAISIRKKRSSLGTANQNQIIPSHAAIQYAAKKNSGVKLSGSQTQRINASTYNRQNNQSYAQGTNASATKKQQNWFSPPSSSHINNLSSQSNAYVKQNVLSTIDNNSTQNMINITQGTSQFVSPRSFLNKSGAGGLQNPSHILSAQQQARNSIGDRNPLLLASYDTTDENFNHVKQQLTFNQTQQIQQQQYNPSSQGDWQKVQKLSQIKFFQNCTLSKFFKKWKNTSGKQNYQKIRLQLSENLIYAKSQTFGESFRSIMYQVNTIKDINFIQESSQKKGTQSMKNLKAVIQVNQFNEAIMSVKNCIEKLQNYIVKSNNEYERRIREGSSVGRRTSTQNDQQSKSQPKKLDKDHIKVIQQRCSTFDKFLQMTLIALTSSITCMLHRNRTLSDNKIKLTVKFQTYGANSVADQDPKNELQQMYSTNAEYFLGTQPPFKSLLENVSSSISESDQIVYNNRKLIESLNKIVTLFFNKNGFNWDVNSFYLRIDTMIKQSQGNFSQVQNKDQILEQVSRDIEEAESVVRRMEDMKQVIQFEERWQQLNSVTQNNQNLDGFVADLESNRETWNLMERFQSMISQIPQKPLTLRYLTLDFKPLYDQLSKIPKKVIQQIERKVASSLESDTLALKQDLSKTYEILEQVPTTLNIYVEQVNTLKFIKETISELNNRHDSIKKLSLMCKTDNRINIKDSVTQNVRDLEQYIENLPNLIRRCQEKLDLTKPQMELQMKQSCMGLSNKIRAFEKKYIDHYLKIEDMSKFNDVAQAKQTLSELKYRQKMIDEMKQKADLYQECINIMNMKELFQKNSDITCFEDQKQLEQLNTYTLKFWTILDEWRSQRASLIQKPFLKINFTEISDFLEESISYIEQRLSEDSSNLYKPKFQQLANLITNEMTELQLTISHVKDLRKDCIKKKHWNMIFNELGLQSLMGRVDEFTLQELQQKGARSIYSYNQEIREITRIAEQEQDFEDQYNLIKSQVEDILKFKLVEYRSSGQDEKIYLISEFDIVQAQLEEFIVILKKGQKSPQMTDVSMKDNFINLFTQIENMLNVLEKLNDAQKMILTLDAIFSQTKVQNTLTNDFKKFNEIKKSFKNNITGRMHQNPTLKNFSSIVNSVLENLERIISTGTLIQKSIEDYLEAKRLAFPRFFFMTDKQFLEFVELAEQNIDFNRFINLLFPGVSKIFLDQPLQPIETQLSQVEFKVPPPMINDLSQVRSEMIDISQNLLAQQHQQQQQILMQQKQASSKSGQQSARMINQKNQVPLKPVIELDNLDKIESQYNTKRSQQQSQSGPKPTQVMGLISTLNELFLFEKKVPYQQNKVECWLQGAETNMQETVGKLINYAVNTFPKQSLDEWILDYPQQVILTTIHLILTHEINELFEEMRKDKENNAQGHNDNGDHHGGNDDSEDDYTGGATPKTPDTRDLIKNSQISHRTISQHVSQKSSIRYMRKKADEAANNNMGMGIAPRKVSTHQFNSKGKSGSQSNYSSQNNQKIKNQQHLKSSQYYSEEGGMINQHDLNTYNLDNNEEEDFTESELEALDMSRERKKFASNMFGSDFDINLITQGAQSQHNKNNDDPNNKDDTMRILQEKSFRGLYLRLQFWINQICKSLYMSKGCNQQWKNSFEKDISQAETPQLHLDLHPVQRLVMQTIINFLSYMRDVVFELKNKKVDIVEDFDWQKQMRLTWNGKDSGCKVDCGAWTTQQANEYFGAQQRVPLTPLTNKYFVFISAAFREKSAVLFRTVPSHDYCGDIFQEFSSICSVPFKEYQCNPKLSMKSLMQFLNGAALASVWIFFEHVDKLDYVHLQTFNKEIQMVQQQFIIAELSQDSSVITAHITVGNQSISQCQRSIERVREQASLESKQINSKNGEESKSRGIRIINGNNQNIIGGGGDIKIEDNIDNNFNYEHGSPSGFEDDDIDGDNSLELQKQRIGREYDDQINILTQHQERLNRQSSKEELQYLAGSKKPFPPYENGQRILQNLSQIDIDGELDFNNDHNQLEEDQFEELKLDEGQNNSIGGGHSKINSQNKVCFGVFASISHQFNLRKEKWATEVSTALQSAFRVLSLTRPEMPIITSMLLKSEGFREYSNLSVKINDALLRVQDMLNLNDRDDSFSITVRDLKRLAKCASSLLEEQIIRKSQEQGLFNKQESQRKSKLSQYSMEKKTKQHILKEIEVEDERDQSQKQIRIALEDGIICYILGLFLNEKLCSFYRNLLIQEDQAKKDIRGIIQSIFGKQTMKNSQIYSNPNNNSQDSQSQLQSVLQAKGMTNMPQTEIKKLKQIQKSVSSSKPVCLIGKQQTGKSLYIRTITISNYREMYGIYDPISTTQQVIEQQIGGVKHSIFSVLRNETNKERSALIVDGEFDQVFNETFLPYLEYQTFQEQHNSEAFSSQALTLMLPNGIQETVKKNVPIIYEMRSLENVSPRFIHAIQVINTRDTIDIKELVQKIKSKIVKKLLSKFKVSQKNAEDSVSYSLNEIIVPALNDLRKAKYLQQSNLKMGRCLQFCSRTFIAILNEIKQLQSNMDQALIKISLMTIFMTVGNLLNQDGKRALEDIFSGLKSQMGVRGSIFNYCLDFDILNIVELRHVGIDNEFVVNPILLRAAHYAQLMLKNNKGFHLQGQIGTQKSTTVRYLLKNFQQDISSRVIKIPVSCFVTQKSLRNLLLQKQAAPTASPQQKPIILILEDVNLMDDNLNFNLLDYLKLTKQNNFQVFNPNFQNIQSLGYKYVSLITSSFDQRQDKNNSNMMFISQDSEEFDGFMKQYIQRNLQVTPSHQTQLGNVIYDTYKHLQLNSDNFNVSSQINFGNLHIVSSLISRINQSKDQNIVDKVLIEVQRTITDRIIYPSLKNKVYENLILSLKRQIPSSNTDYKPNQIDSLLYVQNGEKSLTSFDQVTEFMGDFSAPILKQLCSLYQNLKKPNKHYLYVSKTGSDIQSGIEAVANKLKYTIQKPEIQKYRDAFTLIEQINLYLYESLKSSKRMIILIEDSRINDLCYIDYLLNLITAIKDSTSHCSLSFFNSLDQILGTNLRQQLIDISREHYNQQISHSPHSGISSPASPSSLTASITDSQLLINALSKISQNVHFIFLIQNLQNYQSYTSKYKSLETLFQIAFIPEFKDQSEDILSEVQRMVHNFSLSKIYSDSYLSTMDKTEKLFNNEYNAFYIPEHKVDNILIDPLFDSINMNQVNSELNLSLPSEFTLSSQRGNLFVELVQTIKNFLYKQLASQKQFYQQYFNQYEELQADFMKKILTKDQSSISKNHVVVFNLVSIQDKIDLLQQQLKYKDQLSKQKEKERSDLSQNLEKLKDDLQINKTSTEGHVIQNILRLKQVPSTEYKTLAQAIQAGQLNDSDQEIIQALQSTLQTKKPVQSFLLSPQDLIQRLQSIVQSQNIDSVIQRHQKSVVKRLQQNEQDKSLIVVICKVLNEIFKKGQLDKKYQAHEQKIKVAKDQLSFIQTSLKLYQQQMQEIREEVEDLLIKEKNMKAEMKDVIRRVDMKDIKQLRNDYKLKSLLKQGKKSESKLDKVKIRMKNLDGDSIILACTVAYLGAFSVAERMEFRKQLAEKILGSRNIESSEYWQNTQSEQIHSKYFKKIIQNDLSLKSNIFNKLNHLFVDSLFSEFLFTYMFCPTIPVIYDSVGNYQQELTEEILDELNSYKVKVVFSSDYMIQEKIDNALQIFPNNPQKAQSNQLIFINDLCDFSNHIQGKAQDQSILHRLSEREYFKRVGSMLRDNVTLSLPTITLFSASSHYNLNQDYLAQATIINATFVNKNEAWIEIKQILLKHFLPDNYQKLTMIKQQTQLLRFKLLERQKAFEQLFMKVKRHSVEEKDHKALEDIRLCYIDIKQLDEDYQQYNQAFHNLINEHPLLASYSNIFVILFFALKELSKFTEEITYSWKIYTKVIDMIIAKIIRDLTMNLKNKENEESDGEGDDPDNPNNDDLGDDGGRRKKKKDKEFTIDEEFFHSVIMPSIYSTIVAGIKQEHVSLFNLIFSMEIALKKTTVNQEDKDFFINRFFRIKNCYDWRLNPHKPSTIPTGFADISQNQRIKQAEYMTIKRDILKIYPDLRKLFETIEIKIGKEFTYKEANNLLYMKLFKQGGNSEISSTWKDLPLIKKLNVGFLCPDDEWRSKICQFVFEELTTIFDFNEDLNKLHNFIKTASWSLPIALFTSNSINIVNTVCSIASYYGVGLEVLRTDYQQSIKKHEKYYINKDINDNIKSAQMDMDPEKPLSNEAACVHYDQIDPSKEDRLLMQKHNYQRMFSKDELEIDDKQITQNQSSIQLIEKCAENGTWVLISTLKFPSFWYKISRKLEKMAKKGKVLNTFRLFFDLQGYSLQEIPESFLFNHSVKFYLTEKNNEDMEGFNDVWANILNDDLLNAKDLHNVPILEPPSDMVKINLNLESNLYESSIDSLIPQMQGQYSKDQLNPNQHLAGKKQVKDDKITYSMSQYQSKDTIQLPQIFTQDHMRDIMLGGEDLRSPTNGFNGPQKIQNRLHKQNLEDEISEISIHNHFMQSGLVSNGQSLMLMDDMSRMEGAFLSELNQAFARKMSSVNKEEEQKQQPKYEMVKKPAPNHKRQQPPQKQ